MDLSVAQRLPLTAINIMFIVSIMIRSFAGTETERFLRRAAMRLRQLDAATRVDDLRLPPSNRLEALKGDRIGQYSIRINDQWRICFRFVAGDAFDVEITDYH